MCSRNIHKIGILSLFFDSHDFIGIFLNKSYSTLATVKTGIRFLSLLCQVLGIYIGVLNNEYY